MAGFERYLWELENPTNGLVVSYIFNKVILRSVMLAHTGVPNRKTSFEQQCWSSGDAEVW